MISQIWSTLIDVSWPFVICPFDFDNPYNFGTRQGIKKW